MAPMPSTLPSPADDYAAPQAMRVNRAVWDSVFGSIGTRLRALEAVQADFEALITAGTGQALASIAANIEPELVAARAALTQLQADTAAAEDAVAAIVAGSIPLGSVAGLTAALAAKATPADIASALDALKGGAPAAYDTLVEIAAALDADASAITTILAGITAASILTKLQTVDGAGSGLDADLLRGVAPGAGGLTMLAKAGVPFAPLRNRHLNPGFQVCQDRAVGATVAMSASGYVMDGVAVDVGGGGVLTCSQVAKASPGGSPYRFRASVTTADASIAAGDLYGLRVLTDGIDVADLQFGTTSARSFVWRGGVNLPAGTYGLAFRNADGTRSYVTTFTVSAGEAGTDKTVTATVPGDTTGTWIKDASGVGIWATITVAGGATYQTAATGAWAAGDHRTTSAQTNAMASTANTIEVFDVGLYAGSELPTWEYPRLDEETRRCYRHYWAGTGNNVINPTSAAANVSVSTPFPVTMRAVPAVTVTSSNVQFTGADGVTCFVYTPGGGSWGYTGTVYANARPPL